MKPFVVILSPWCHSLLLRRMKITSIHTAVIPNGNILTKTDSSTNTTVNYGYTDPTWADLLTSYKGQTITYDEIGNPLTYRDGMSFTWSEGRQLSTVTKNGSVYNYYYDGEGYRSQKMVNNNSTQYTVIDGVIYGEVTYGTTGATQIYYYYDDGGRAYGFSYNGTMYYYQFNLQGDVTGIYNSNGQLVTEYKYDSWGKVLSVTGSMAGTVGQANPIRYRGYYYDSETGFYFLQSRYYDPETGRVLNADGVISGSGETVKGYNQFAYCFNNPINMSDETGNWPTWHDIGNKIKEGVQWVTDKIVKPIVQTGKKLWQTVVKGTTTTGVAVSGSFGISGTGSLGVSYDSEGNLGIVVSGGGGGGTPSASASLFKTKTSAPSIDNLEGVSAQIGGSINVVGIGVGAEYSCIPNIETKDIYHGVTFSAGIGAPIPAELHGNVTYTQVYYINIFDCFDMLYDKVMEW